MNFDKDFFRLLFSSIDKEDLETFSALASTCTMARDVAVELSNQTYEEYIKWRHQKMFCLLIESNLRMREGGVPL